MANTLPPQEILSELLSYDAETGMLSWRARGIHWFTDGEQTAVHNQKVWNAKFAGKPALNLSGSKRKHKRGTLLWRGVFAHRVIWKLVYGVEPDEVDHIDGDGSNNRLPNLRDVSHKINGRNVKRRNDNTSGYTGTLWDARISKWLAVVTVDGRRKQLGAFLTPAEASAARSDFLAQHGFHPNHGRVA